MRDDLLEFLDYLVECEWMVGMLPTTRRNIVEDFLSGRSAPPAPKWECVMGGTFRMRVHGGWLVRVQSGGVGLVFVPDASGEWVI